jgi:serine protease inhibitor
MITKPLLRLLLLSLLILSLVLGALLCGCQDTGANLMVHVQAAARPSDPAEPDEAFRASGSAFAWDLFREASKNSGNILISPASVYLALAMTLNGASQDTRTAMLAALSAKSLDGNQLNQACRDWMTLLMHAGGKTQLTIANSIWYRQGYKPNRNFLQSNADYFAAAARALDFDQASAVGAINRWVKNSTRGKIEKIVAQISPDVMMYLINTIYFQAEWLTKFKTAKTAAGDFSTPSGSSQAQFMIRVGNMDYLDAAGAQGVLLPYQDGRFALMALLPAAGRTPRQLIDILSPGFLDDLLKNRRKASVELKLPRFEIRFEDSLKNELSALGMAVAFDPDLADFSLMNADHLRRLYISEIRHATYCRVDESGTVAAAATSAGFGLTSLIGDRKLYFDRPFIYGIIDTKTNLPLFLGILEDPAKP